LPSRSSQAQAQTKIDFFFPVPVDGKLAKEMTRLVKVYNDSQKEVAVTAVYTGSYDETKLKAQAATGAGKPPAVVLMSANFVLDLKIAGDIVSLEPQLKAEGTTRAKFLDDFWPAVHANAIVDGELYAIPYQNSTPLLYYNKEHFKAAGLNPDKPPQTWTELVDAAKKLTTADHMGFGLPEGYDYMGWIMEALCMSNGGRYYNEEYGGEVYYDTPTMLGAAQFVEDLVFKHKVMQQGVVEGGALSTNFLAGKVSMMLLSTGSLSFVRDNMKMAFGVAFVPRNVRNAVPIGGGSLVMFKGLSDEQKAAGWKFAKWLSSTETLGGWSRFTGYFSPRKSAYDTAEMKDFMAKNPEAQVAINQLP
jgi:sn-glycerol 3-phosphate transport system substrate-binding protein